MIATLAVAAAVVASPAYATGAAGSPLTGPVLPRDPGPGTVPDIGARPGGANPGGTNPGGLNPTFPQQPAAPPVGPLATQIMNEQRTVEALGEQVKEAQQNLTRIRQLSGSSRTAASDAEQMVDRARDSARDTAKRAYQDSARVPKQISDFTATFRNLGPGLRARTVERDKSAGWALQRAEELARLTAEARDTASRAEQTATSTLALLQQQYSLRSQALQLLRNQNAEAVRLAEQARDNFEDDFGDDLGLGGNGQGMVAHPKALAAVKYALRQRGKPYVWGAEGPNAFDCSGLVWAAYRTVGVSTPRVARPQYLATDHARVPLDQLLPGDLIFFGPDRSNWVSIHHVGIYVGNGRIVHAPNSRTVVKVSPIWWSEFFGATRVVPAVKAKPTPTPTPKPTTPPPTTPGPSPSTPPPWSPSPNPSGNNTPSQNGSTTPNSSQSANGAATPKPSPNPPAGSAPPSGASSGSSNGSPAPGCTTGSPAPSSPAPSSPAPSPTPTGTLGPTPSCPAS